MKILLNYLKSIYPSGYEKIIKNEKILKYYY